MKIIMRGLILLFLVLVSFIFTGNTQAQLVPTIFTPYACNTGPTANTIEPGQACSGINVNNHTCADFGYWPTGTGATISIVASSGVITLGTITAGGNGYKVNDILAVVGGSGGFFQVTGLNGTAVSAITLQAAGVNSYMGGINYTTGTGLATYDLGPVVGCNSNCLSYDFSNCPTSTGTVITAPSCNYFDVQNTIYSATAGQTVLIPSGTCTWVTPVIKPGKTPMTILGSGEGVTTIIDGNSKVNDNNGAMADINITASSGVITAINIVSGGTQYVAGTVLSIFQPPSASGGTFIVNSITGNGVISSVSIVSGGTGYTTANNVLVSESGGQALIFNTDLGGLNRLTNLTIQGGPANDPLNAGMVKITGYSQSLRVDHNSFYPLSTAAMELYTYLLGVIDHNTFNFVDASLRDGYGTYVHHDAWDNITSDGQSWGDGSWADPLYLGTEKAVYIENNSYNYTYTSSGHIATAIDGWTGQRTVFRNNNLLNTRWANHGTESPGLLRGTRSWEWYSNTSTLSPGNSFSTAMATRSGNGVIYDNIINGSFNAAETSNEYRDVNSFSIWEQCDGSGPYDLNNLTAGSPTLFASGTATSANSSANPVLTDISKSWSTNYWLPAEDPTPPYSVINTTTGRATIIESNTSDTITGVESEIAPSLTWAVGNAYVVQQAYACIDQTGRGQGTLITRNSSGDPAVTGWPNEVLEPSYSWNNEWNGVNVGGVIRTPAGSHIQENIDYFNNVQAPGYVPYVYPHPSTLLPLTVSNTGNGLGVSGSIATSCSTNSDCSQGQNCSSGQCSPNNTFNCQGSSPNVCSETVNSGNSGNSVVMLTATPASGTTFIGWTVTGQTGTAGADCAGTTGTCTLTVSAATSVTANSVTSYVTPSSGVQYGDVNGAVNGAGQSIVTIVDAELVAQSVVGLITLTPAQQQAAMVSSKTETQPSIYDAFLIAEYAVGKITEFPVQ